MKWFVDMKNRQRSELREFALVGVLLVLMILATL